MVLANSVNCLENAPLAAAVLVFQVQVFGVVPPVQRAQHRLQALGKAVEGSQQLAFRGAADLGVLRNRLEAFEFRLGFGQQLLHDAGVLGRARLVARRALRGGDIGADGGAQHLHVRVLDQIALLDTQAIQSVDRFGVGAHAVPTQGNCNQRGHGDCQLGKHQTRAHLQIA